MCFIFIVQATMNRLSTWILKKRSRDYCKTGDAIGEWMEDCKQSHCCRYTKFLSINKPIVLRSARGKRDAVALIAKPYTPL